MPNVRYLMLLREKVVSCLREKTALSTVTFVQDLATRHTANPVKEFLIQMFGEEKIISIMCKFSWTPRSPDLTPAGFGCRDSCGGGREEHVLQK
ncbi:uncharacterized protein TNCV_4783601 [Trichonephila clavipes]|nr:uncharacterized protein TNCV_4783601 [Trichonephila clavipes]